MKSHQNQTSQGSLSLPLNTIIPLPPNVPNNCTHPNKPQKTFFLSKRRMEKELLDCCTNISLPCKANIELLQEETPHCPHILAVLKEVIQIFSRFPTKNTAKKPHKRSSSPNKRIKSVHTTKQDLPNKIPDFLSNLDPPNHIKHILPNGEEIQ